MLISVIMPAFNCEDTIRIAIDSILAQSFDDFEFLICDDCSSDKTFEFIKAYESNQRIRIFRNITNIGVTPTLNRLVREARGELIARMDSDDVAYPNRLKLQVEYMRKGCYDLVFSGADLIDYNGDVICKINTPNEKKALALLNKKCYLIHPTALIKRNVFEKYGHYNEAFRHGQDWELWKRIQNNVLIGILHEQQLLGYRLNLKSITLTRLNKVSNDYWFEAGKACIRNFDQSNYPTILKKLSLIQRIKLFGLRHSCYYRIKHFYWTQP